MNAEEVETAGAASGRRAALVVMGMHRSGTSAMTRVLSLSGAHLPARLMPALPENPVGVWEPRALAALNVELLAAIDSRWDNVLAIRDGERAWAVRDRFLERARTVLADDFPVGDILAIKDPRISILSRFWTLALESLGIEPTFVIVVRDPLEVAASLFERDGISTPKALLLWTSYMVAVERDTRAHRRLFVHYDDLLNDWRPVLDRVEAAMGRPLPWRTPEAAGAIDAFLSGSHRHHLAEPSALFDRPNTWAGVQTVYWWMLAAAAGRVESPAPLAQIERELEALERCVGAVLASRHTEDAALSSQLWHVQQEAACLRLDVEAQKAKIAILKRRLQLAGAPSDPDTPPSA